MQIRLEVSVLSLQVVYPVIGSYLLLILNDFAIYKVHPAGRALTSHWSVNSFIMVVYKKQNFGHASNRKFWLHLKKAS